MKRENFPKKSFFTLKTEIKVLKNCEFWEVTLNKICLSTDLKFNRKYFFNL